MSLPGSPMSAGPRWAPTHVQVTVLQARGLRAKAKGGGGSDAYAVMALGKEKFATSVAERCLGSPVWREEATFELPPPPRRGLSGYEEEGRGAQPAVLQLTVSHRALLGLDKFLGRAEVNLAELQNEGGRRTTRWYKLHSKPGKKEKERGEIEVDIQFMRSNMTASMFDLSMKDKSRTPFGKLKDKLKGKRGNGLPDTASAIIPSITHSLADSDEESNEKEKEKKKSKFKTLFSKPGLQKSNISQSMSVLPSLQPVTERVRLRPSDFQSQWDDDDDDTLTPVSEKPPANRAEDNFLYPPSGRSHKRTGSADSKQLNQIASSSTKKDGHSLFGGLKSKNDPVSRSNVCINGSHVYVEECDPKSDTILKENTPSSTSPSPQTSRRKHLFSSQENLTSIPSKDPEVTGRLALDKGPPESSSLESFKASLPSYKLLSSGDLLESIAPMISDTSKEIKKQENMKSALLSLVTGKKEAENSSEVSVKVKEVKHNERELAGKETTPCEVPVDCRRDQGPDKRKSTNAAIPKASFNPFTENTEEEKSEKSAASVKPSQARPIKPSSSQPYSASSFQSDALSSNKAESPKKSAVEGLDVKVDSSGKKKLLQARVSPSETHSNQTQQSGGTVPAKLRLHPVKPMNTTTNKPPAKTLNVTAKILDNQNETNLKKYDPSDPAYAYAQLTHDELIQLVLKQKDVIAKRDNQVRELEDYIDDLLVRVMEETPNILRVQPSLNKKAGRM
ncbi:rab11 family-interacting protein 1 isoform X3 [Heteronotia binoei]|uniref:rab11 family-interacting protein 1 isoform X3 n=1 Tax=Heteronotia binoei TaxID=13085 RepID=UPI00292CFFB6|nr:rab11 family-interacting protein 1 isoform X3 [Heteronotia binoei]